MKKIWRMLFVLSAAVLFLAGCNGGTSDTSTDTEEEETTTETTEEPSNESDDDSAAGDEVLTISAIPDYDATELNRAFSDFATLLSDELGIEVEYVESVDYASVVTGYERGDIDLAWFGGLTGAQAINAVEDTEAFAQRPQDAVFQSVFIRNIEQAGDVESLADVPGHSFTFGSESSTSGHIMPRYFFSEEGITPEEDFNGQVNYSGSHDTTMELVETGSYDLGVVNMQYWDNAVEEGTVDETMVEEFYRSPEFYDYNWQVRSTIDEKFGEGTKDQLIEYILGMTREDSEMMEILDADEFIPTENSNYDMIADVAREIGILEN